MPKDGDKIHPRRAVSIMSSEEVKSGKKSHWEELDIKGPVRNLSPAIWKLSHLTSLFLNDNQLQRIPPDISRLRNLFLLDLSSNKLRSLPAELGDLYNLRELLLNNNCLRSLPYELGKLFQLHCLGLVGNPLSPDIMTMYNKGTPRLLTYFLDNLALTTPEPPERQWIRISDPENTGSPTALFSVMSYNILCDKYATRQMYGYCPPWALNWEYRRNTIFKEILHYSADIISLQEVETCEYNNFFVPELKLHGYEGVFSPKSRAKHMIEDDKRHVDGCAIFWKTAKFTLVKEHLIEFNQIAMENNEGSEHMLNRVTTKDNIGIAVLLQTNDGIYEQPPGGFSPQLPKQHMLAATAHMHWDPEFSDVKLIQTVIFCHELKRICDESTQSLRPRTISGNPSSPEVPQMPMIVCGDLNSLPESGVVEYLTTGKVSTSHEDFRDLKYTKTLSNFSHRLREIDGQNDPDIITHPFKLNSSYDENTRHCLEYSNHTFEFKGIIDYIFYTRSQMRNLAVLSGIDSNWFIENNILGCPHPNIPSDHIPLVSEYQLYPPNYQPQSPSPPNALGSQYSMSMQHSHRGSSSPSFHHLNNHMPFHHGGMANGFHPLFSNSHSHPSRGFGGPRRSSPITNSNSTPPMGMGSLSMPMNGRR